MEYTSNLKPIDRIDKALDKLDNEQVQMIFNHGNWQLYHLLEWILLQVGKASIVCTSFSISEEFIRALVRLKNEHITSLSMFIDDRASTQSTRLTHFVNNVCNNLWLGKNHSKILLISNDMFKVTVVTSQNLTRGNRCEAGTVSTRECDYFNILNEIDEQLKTARNATELYNKTT